MWTYTDNVKAFCPASLKTFCMKLFVCINASEKSRTIEAFCLHRAYEKITMQTPWMEHKIN